MRQIILYFIFILLISSSYAHETSNGVTDLAVTIKYTAVNYLIIASIIAGVFVLISYYAYRKKYTHYKTIMFSGIVVPILISTLYLVGGTIYVNSISETKGPIHWHADFEIYGCDNWIDLKDPTGISNRIGTPVFHEHGDNRVHVEGTVVKKSTIDLHNFFSVIGGELTENTVTIPTDDGQISYTNGDLCNGQEGTLQVFVYKTTGTAVTQEKITDFENYILSPYQQVPPGDCVIIEFGEEKQHTTHMCSSYRLALEKANGS